jgi:methyl-accepting chemotaxis protein WspA
MPLPEIDNHLFPCPADIEEERHSPRCAWSLTVRLMLKHKMMGLACVAAVLPLVVLLVLADLEKERISAMMLEELTALIQDNVARNAQDVYHTCEPAQQFIQRQVEYNLNVADKVLSLAGAVGLEKQKERWHAVSQINSGSIDVSLPRMTVGGTPFGQNRESSRPTPVVDEVVRLVGGACTVFQRMNDRGDMIRVATTIRAADQTRAIGTYIAATEPDGTPNRVIATVMQGQVFRGRAFVVDTWYITAYQPITDSEGDVVGMLFVGIEQRRIDGLRDAILNVRVGKTGGVFVVRGKGETKGTYVVASEAEVNGGGIWEARDAEGKPFGQAIVKKATGLKAGEIAFERYLMASPADRVPRPRLAAIAYFEPWDWVIVANTFEDEFYDAHHKTFAGLSLLFRWSIAGGLIATAVALGIAFFMASRAAAPITRITRIAQQIAAGDLLDASKSVQAISGPPSAPDSATPATRSVSVFQVSQDETAQLLSAINGMTGNLNSLIGQVKQSTIQLVSTSTEIAAASRQQEAAVNEFGASTSEVVAATKEISATSQELVHTMQDVTHLAGNTASLAGSGRAGLVTMESTMRQLADATRLISNKLAVISDRTGNINSVVTTITKVADETNLLSLNAAIEAEKAGEYGLGFSVVAREIRRLADQTAVATLDIEQMVKEMRSAVSSGVMEMDKFSEEVRRSAVEVQTVSGHLATIIEQVQSLTPRFDAVTHGMQVQAEGADQISKAMVQLNESAQQTAQSLHEFNKATEQLNDAARNLRTEVSRFKV